MSAVILIVSLTPLILVTGIIGYYFDVSYREKVIDNLNLLIEKHSRNIDSFLMERLADIKVIARTYPLAKLQDNDFLKEKLSVIIGEYGRSFVDLGLVNEDGIQVAYSGPYKLKNADYSKAEWFREAISRDDYISDVFHGLRGYPHFVVAVRIEDEGRKWILRATVDFESFNSMVENIRVGSTGFAFIINRKGDLQTIPKVDSIPCKDTYTEYLSKSPAAIKQVTKLEAGKTGRSDCILIAAPINKGNWLLGYQQEESDAFSVLNRTRRLAFMIVLLGGMAIVSVAFFTVRRIVGHIAQADDEKELMNEQMIEAGKLASLGELAAGIAHEINNPVAIMVEEAGWIQDLMLEEDLAGSANFQEFKRSLNQIRTQGKRCKEITHKLLSFARKTDPSVKSVQLNEVIRDVVSLTEQRARYSNIRINVQLEQDLPEVNVSPSELQQVLLNLINNSVDALEGKGGIIDIRSEMNENYITLEVADNGPGIPKTNMPRIFDPFFTTKPVGKGTGLGLSICYGIVKRIGGEIQVNSVAGAGVTFRIMIPKTNKDAGELEDQPHAKVM
jgi:two-component system NtrC family sensor kinase